MYKVKICYTKNYKFNESFLSLFVCYTENAATKSNQFYESFARNSYNSGANVSGYYLFCLFYF